MMLQFNPPRDMQKGQLKDMIDLLCDGEVFSVERALLMAARNKGYHVNSDFPGSRALYQSLSARQRLI